MLGLCWQATCPKAQRGQPPRSPTPAMKPFFKILTVCSFVALLGGYVVYAHRRAQSAAPVASSVPGSSPEATVRIGNPEFVEEANPSPPVVSRNVMASSSKSGVGLISPDAFEDFTKAKNAASVAGSLTSPPAQFGMTQAVTPRPDGSTVTTRVIQDKPPTFAPSSKVLIRVIAAEQPQPAAPQPVQLPNGTVVKPGTIHHGQSPQLLTVLPPPSPSSARQTVGPNELPGIVGIPAKPGARLTIPSTKSAPVFTPSPPTAPATTVAPAVTAPAPTPSAPNPAPVESPKPRMIAPGSKSIDLLLFEKKEGQTVPKGLGTQAQSKGGTP